MRYLAHSVSPLGHVDLVRDHLTRVGNRAARLAKAFEAEDEARIAGLLHDLGKYGDLFQRRLEGKERGIDHWSAGAWHALTTLGTNGIAIALAVQGHHLGLRQASRDALALLDPRKVGALGLRPSSPDAKTPIQRFHADGLAVDGLDSSLYETDRHLKQGLETAAGMLDVRMLFSALVDADFEETEAHFRGSEATGPSPRTPGPDLNAEVALASLLAHVDGLISRYNGSRSILRVRQALLESCLAAAVQDPGLFTLTAPTGSGKTLSMLAFALSHALHNDLRRVVVVIPYLTIIEQTAAAYRAALTSIFDMVQASEYVLEDHSLAALTGSDKGDGLQDEQDVVVQRARELAENWDAPVIVTTSVQFLESLFANRPSACRKLHRLVKSVVLIDEVQTIPKELAIPTLATLGHLVERYGSTVVFATATQPAFSHLDCHVRKHCVLGWKPKEIVDKGAGLFSRAGRVQVVWRGREKALTWGVLAEEICATPHDRVLCIVNLKKHAVALYQALSGRRSGAIFHLSTNMCPAHRGQVLEEVRRRLAAYDGCVLVSTQCVEAGVDLDFPVVYRAFGPLDAIAQAAGRCNRNGLLESGIVHVFEPSLDDDEHGYPDGAYRQAADVTRMLIAGSSARELDISDQKTFELYFRTLYQLTRPEDGRKDITQAIGTQDFQRVGELYRLIDNDTIDVLVPYDEASFDDLRGRASRHGVTRDWAREARPHSVALYRPSEGDPLWSHLEPLPLVGRHRSDAWFAYTRREDYHDDVGLIPGSSLNCLIA